MSRRAANDWIWERRTPRGLWLLFKKVSAVLQHRADKTDTLEDLYISSPSDSYVGQETHLHFTLASLATLHVL